MSNHPGVHCDGCKGGGSSGWLLVPVGAAVILALIIHRYWHLIVEVVQITAWTVLSLAGASIVSLLVVASMRAFQARPRQVRYRRLRQRRSAPIKIKLLGTGATPQHRELMDRMNDDLARQATHLTDEPIGAPR